MERGDDSGFAASTSTSTSVLKVEHVDSVLAAERFISLGLKHVEDYARLSPRSAEEEESSSSSSSEDQNQKPEAEAED